VASKPIGPGSEGEWLRRLADVGRELTSELDQSVVLDRVLESAREITGARYAAIGILNEEKNRLAQFLTAGVDAATHQAIGDPPTGKGVLGALIEHPQPLRLADVGRYPTSYGFPAAHPVMHSFLGVPMVMGEQVWGIFYMAEKAEGEFTEADEEAAVTLAKWASIAIENARRYETSEQRQLESEKHALSLEATRDVVVAIGEQIELENVLEMIAKRGRALVAAKSLVLMLRDGEELVVHTSVGHAQAMPGVRLPASGSNWAHVLSGRAAERITDVGARLRFWPEEFGVTDPQTALLVPMLYRGDAIGILAAFDRGEDSEPFSDDDEDSLRSFAASTATAVSLAQSVAADRLRSSLASAEGERRRCARELHDETLQGLAGLRLLLSSALRREDPEQPEQALSTMRTAMEHIDREIENLRTIITELRPAALDELGLKIAIESLLDRHREQSGLEVFGELTVPDPVKGGTRFDSDLESAVYRLVQEALTNVIKHAKASAVRVAVAESAGGLEIEVQDNGTGFSPEVVSQGFGLQGMRERVGLAGGTLTITSDEHGTLIRACLPISAGAGNHLRPAAVSA
jgi:signal transduction histidine kinase